MESELIKQWNSNQKSEAPLGVFGILRESFKTIKRNGKLLVPVLVLVFLIFSHLDFAETYLIEPVAEDFSLQLAKHPTLLQDIGVNMHKPDYSDALKDIREVLGVQLLFSAFSLLISLVFFVAIVSSSYEAYTAKVLTPKEMILRIKKTLKRPMLTGFYMILIIFGSVFVGTLSIGIISVLAKDSLPYVYGALVFLIPILCFYIGALWIMSMVVSVLEDVGGFNAIARARELMKGKKLQVLLIIVIVAFAYGLVHLMTNALTSYNLDKWSKLAVSIPLTNGLICTLKVFIYVVFTVFYHERKESCDEKEVKGLYVPIAAGEV